MTSGEGLVTEVVGHRVPSDAHRHQLPLTVVREVGQVHGVPAVDHVPTRLNK